LHAPGGSTGEDLAHRGGVEGGEDVLAVHEYLGPELVGDPQGSPHGRTVLQLRKYQYPGPMLVQERGGLTGS
jgi:hypothetical protein